MNPGMDDATLMSRVRSGDREAFGQLVDRHKDALVNYLTGLARSRDRAEELARNPSCVFTNPRLDTESRVSSCRFCFASRPTCCGRKRGGRAAIDSSR